MTSVPAATHRSVPSQEPVQAAPVAAEEVLAQVFAELESSQTQDARRRLREAQRSRAERLERAFAAMQSSKRKRKKAGFFKKLGRIAKQVGKYAAIAGAIASIPMTGGSSLLAVAAIGSLATAELLKRTGNDLNLGTVKVFGLRVDVKLSDTLQLASTAATLGAGGTAVGSGFLQQTCSAVRQAAPLVQAAASATQGVAVHQEGAFTAAALRSDADAVAERAGMKQDDQQARDAVELVRDVSALRQRAYQALAGIVETRADARRHLMEVRG